ncbi:MAG: 50S ribosomal protein L4 [Candidatus Kerfeldbacteria bacterium RIFCSPHIGHO2_12_FULL_48_17]|uniref:Large ribosomal subunit protein uL4 n=1 Tax=Candidatus Kerfeldbacteria bacterium RIFCSPHIGHO2_12_FULL_48_17 TaxID=1798542 RepID=A0A1G2B6J3_9BACT|nr:MAG: 50S ribosomal protein L4 [Candidatus Kerfeldbacteria bacterium RIFCSPHIGHO2_12_FULL_48_17]
MSKVTLYTKEGVKTEQTIDLPPKMWEVELNPQLIHQAVVAHQANAREAIAHTRTRGEVRGGGRKPWKQKGTGNARQGSIRSPLWVGGGITFGPRNTRNFTIAMNKKAKKKALFMVLSNKLAHDRLVVVDDFNFEKPKTRLIADMVAKLPPKGKAAVIVLPKTQSTLARAVRNLPKVNALAAKSLNVYDLLHKDWLIVSKAALEEMHSTYLS